MTETGSPTGEALPPSEASAEETTSPTGTPVAPEPAGPAPSGRGSQGGAGDNPLRHSRTSGLWVATIAAGVILILLIIFIVQNTQKVQVDFLGWSGSPPLAVALLVAAAAGILITGLVGTLRIFQLRRRVKKVTRATKRQR